MVKWHNILTALNSGILERGEIGSKMFSYLLLCGPHFSHITLFCENPEFG